MFDQICAQLATGPVDPALNKPWNAVCSVLYVAASVAIAEQFDGEAGETSILDFLGFGLPPGSPSLGELLAQGKANLQAPWLGLSGFFTIAAMLSLLIFIGEAVRDAFDPRKTLM